jgi:RNA polymerase sigma factor (sigma-70 family)
VADHSSTHLSGIATPRTLFGKAHDKDVPEEQRQAARGELLLRYQGAVKRYLAGALRGAVNREDLVGECFQRFSERMLDGRFRGADPDRGRFRYYLRRSLGNLVNDIYRDIAREPDGLGGRDPVAPEPLEESWREVLMQRALEALREHEANSGAGHYTVLKLKMDGLKAEEIGQRLGAGGKAITAVAIRRRLTRAREKLVELLREEVRQTLSAPSEEDVDEELADLGLLEYCRAGRADQPGA